MARPKKQTVDYFPHQCNHGKTMFILEQRYGNDGYAFWFKLLEILGSTEGHAIDVNDNTAWSFLCAKVRLDDLKCREILTLLSSLNAIDKELWDSGIVWSQNFVDNIADVYTRFRHTKPPCRPNNYAEKPNDTPQSTQESTQSKVKERKEKKKELPNPEVREVIDHFKTACQERKQFEPTINYPKAGKLVKDRLKEFTAEGLKSAIDFFLTSDKSRDHPTIAVAMSEHSLNLWQASLPK